jgi:hypothetical protein
VKRTPVCIKFFSKHKKKKGGSRKMLMDVLGSQDSQLLISTKKGFELATTTPKLQVGGYTLLLKMNTKGGAVDFVYREANESDSLSFFRATQLPNPITKNFSKNACLSRNLSKSQNKSTKMNSDVRIDCDSC